MVSGTPILFSPANVSRVLEGHPTLASLLPDPAREGTDSGAFPGVLRKTERELYRWIANTHYEHLVGPIAQLERVHAAGCRFDRMLKTRSRELFVSHSAEMLVADDLLQRGYEVTTIETSDERSPDLHVFGEGIDMALEVYSPRELRAVDDWTHEVGDLLQYVDIAASFSSGAATSFEKTIPPEPWQFDPWAVADMIDETHAVVLAEVTHDVEEALRTLQPLAKTYPHPGTPLVTSVQLDDVQPAPEGGPMRTGTISNPGFSGYSPAGVFKKTVEKSLQKAKRRQTQGAAGDTRAQVVYLMGTQIAADLTHPAHSKQAEAVLDDVDPTDYGLDVIAFVVRANPTGLASIFAVADDANLSLEQVQALFMQRR
jgi:hypothetical protein